MLKNKMKIILSSTIISMSFSSISLAQDAPKIPEGLPDPSAEVIEIPDLTKQDMNPENLNFIQNTGVLENEIEFDNRIKSTIDSVGTYKPSSKEVINLRDMGQMLQERRVLELYKGNVDLVSELHTKLFSDDENQGSESDVNYTDIGNNSPEQNNVNQPVNNFQPLPEPNPVVFKILGVGDDIVATILVPYFGQYKVKKGEMLPNGMLVSDISKDGVLVLDKNKNNLKLGFGTSVPMTRNMMPQMQMEPIQSSININGMR